MVVLHLLLLTWVSHAVLLFVVSVLLLYLLDALMEVVGLEDECTLNDKLGLIEEEYARFVVLDGLILVIVAILPKHQVLLLSAYLKERVIGLLDLRQYNRIESMLQLIVDLQLPDLEHLRRLLDQITLPLFLLDRA